MPGQFVVSPLPSGPLVRVSDNGDYVVFGQISFFEGNAVDVGGSTLSCMGSGGLGCNFLAKYTQAHTLIWARALEQSPNWHLDIYDGAIDGQGNVVLVAGCQGPGTIGAELLDCELDDPLTPQNEFDGVVAQISPDGDTLWSRAVGGDPIQKLAIDPITDEIVVGQGPSLQASDYGSGPISNVYSAKLDPGGSVIWVQSAGTAGGGVEIRELAVGQSGKIVVLAYLGGTPVGYTGSFFGQPYDYTTDGVWLASITSGGVYVSHEDMAKATVTSMALDLAENVVFTLGTNNNFQFSTVSCSSLSDGLDYIVKLDSAGGCVWSHELTAATGTPYFGGLHRGGLQTDSAGEVYYKVLTQPVFMQQQFAVQRRSDSTGDIVWTAPATVLGSGHSLYGPFHTTAAGATTWVTREPGSMGAMWAYSLLQLP